MSVISREDFVGSIADGLQYISFYHPPDFIRAMTRAFEREESPAAKNAIGQILLNSKMAALGQRPVCQDTGIVVVFLKFGLNVSFDTNDSVQEMVDEGVRRAYNNPDNPLRPSVVSPPFGERRNTGDNTPAVVHTELVAGDAIEITLAAKGGGSENKARFSILNPSDSLSDWVVETIPGMGAGWCPPGILGIGVGGTPEKAMVLAKESLMSAIDMDELISKGPDNDIDALRLEIYQRVNQTGYRRSGPRWAHDRAGCQDPVVPHPCCLPPHRDDSQLCCHAAHTLFSGWHWTCQADATRPWQLARDWDRRREPRPADQCRHTHSK